MQADLTKFASIEYPLRPSQLKILVTCPWRAAVEFLSTLPDEHGVAGDTGSATHVAVAEMHRGKGVSQALEAMKDRLKEYPKANLTEAAEMFLSYSQDTRNKEAEIILVEKKIRFQIDPSEEDQTKAKIEVEGTLDQVRRENGRLKLWDLKTSKKDPILLLGEYQLQLASYCIGATIELNETVHPGGIILSRRYVPSKPSASPVFYNVAWSFADIPRILAGVRHNVALIRAGRIFHTPNADCQWCYMRTPDMCLPALQKFLSLREKK